MEETDLMLILERDIDDIEAPVYLVNLYMIYDNLYYKCNLN